MHSSWISRIFLVSFVTLTDEAAALGRRSEILDARQQGGILLPLTTIISPTMTSAIPPPQSSTTPILLFEPSLTYTACATGVIHWLFAGPSTPELTIIVNNDVSQDNPPPPLTSSSSNVPQDNPPPPPTSSSNDVPQDNSLPPLTSSSEFVPQDNPLPPLTSSSKFVPQDNPLPSPTSSKVVSQDNPLPSLTSSSSHIQTFSYSLKRRQSPTFPDTVNKTLASNLDPTSDSYSWPSVDVPQGWYQALAIMPTFGQIAQSDPFYVRVGTDTSCLVAATQTRSGISALSSPPSTSSALAMTSGVVALPDSKSSHTGAVAGGIIGGIATLLLGCFCMYRKYKRRWRSVSSNTTTAPNPEPSLRSGTQSLRHLSPSSNGFDDISFAQEYSTSAERHMSSLSSPLPDVPVDTSQPHSRALLTVTAPSTEEVESRRSSFSVPSTAPPLYESPPLSPLPPSFHSFNSPKKH